MAGLTLDIASLVAGPEICRRRTVDCAPWMLLRKREELRILEGRSGFAFLKIGWKEHGRPNLLNLVEPVYTLHFPTSSSCTRLSCLLWKVQPTVLTHPAITCCEAALASALRKSSRMRGSGKIRQGQPGDVIHRFSLELNNHCAI